MFDLHNDILPQVALDGAAIVSDTTTVGNVIDLDGFNSCEFVFYTNVLTDGDYTPLITESTTSGGTYTAVADGDLIGTEAEAAFTTDTDDQKVSRIGYRGNLQFVKCSMVSTGTTSGGVLGAIALLGNADIKAVAGNSQ